MGSNAKTDVAAAALATPRVGARLLLATNFKLFLSSTPQLQDQPTCQDGHVQDQAELPRGLRGVDQQADQHGILCLLRLSLHELLLQPRRPSPAWFRGSLQEGVERGARPRHEVDGVPDQEGRSRCLPGHRQADHDGLGQPMEAMEAALELEKTVNQSLLDIHKVAGDKGDGHLCDFLESEYLTEQVEGIKAVGDLITKMKRAGDGLGLHIIDKEMGS